MRRVLSALGYRNIDDAIEFVMAGLALLPALMFITGNVFTGAASLFVLILLLAALGMRSAPPPSPHDDDPGKRREEGAESSNRE